MHWLLSACKIEFAIHYDKKVGIIYVEKKEKVLDIIDEQT